MKNRILSCLLAVLLLVSAVPSAAAAQDPLAPLLTELAGCFAADLAQPGYGDEWIVLAQSASGDRSAAAAYWESLCQAVSAGQGQLNARRSTETSRALLAVAAIGRDGRDVGGYDLTAPLQDASFAAAQGLNGTIFALLALDAGAWPARARADYIAAICDAQLADGGWAMGSSAADADLTAMALQALAPYRRQARVSAAVEAGLRCLSGLQQADGGFASWGTANCESCAQVILALCQLGLPLPDTRFVKNGHTVLDAMLRYHVGGNGYPFCHSSGSEGTRLPSIQAWLALRSLSRVQAGQPGIYTLTAPAFTDLTGHWAAEAVEALAGRGLLPGTGRFRPDAAMTRGELIRLLWAAADSPEANGAAFTDVSAALDAPTRWARSAGVMNGVSAQQFRPEEQLTRSEMAAALWRMAGKPAAQRAAAEAYPDWAQAPSWARSALNWAVASGLMQGSGGQLRPTDTLTRAEAATLLLRWLEET